MIVEIIQGIADLICYLMVQTKFHTSKDLLIFYKTSTIENFFSVDLFKKQYIKECKEKLKKLDKNDPFYFSINESLGNKLEKDLEGIDQYYKKNLKKKISTKSDH